VTIQTARPAPTFGELGVSPELVGALDADGIRKPFPIQSLVIPDALSGHDVCGQAKTGSGKTLAFGLPLLERVSGSDPRRPRGLVLVPTRELCIQVAEVLRPLAATRGHTVVPVFGGAPLRGQREALGRGAEVVVATPGRLIDLIERGAVHLDRVEVVVIDEADEMADMGFLPQLQSILRTVTSPHQTMLFSATLDHRVQILVRNYMTSPVHRRVESDTVTVDTSVHRFLRVHALDMPKVVARIAEGAGRTLVFCETKRACDRVARQLRDLGIRAQAIHGDLDQARRNRALDGFSRGRTSVLVATNVAARGIDVDGVDVVVNYGAPSDVTTYLHRSGRTARAGRDGLVVTLVDWDQTDRIRRLQKATGIHLEVVKMFSDDPRLDDLTTWQPREVSTPAAPKGRSRHRRRRRLL
jgi:superfamily II DNA/RNA helicase